MTGSLFLFGADPNYGHISGLNGAPKWTFITGLPPPLFATLNFRLRRCFRGSTCAANGVRRLAAFSRAQGLDIDADAARCRWGGERMDYNLAIDALCWQAGYR